MKQHKVDFALRFLSDKEKMVVSDKQLVDLYKSVRAPWGKYLESTSRNLRKRCYE